MKGSCDRKTLERMVRDLIMGEKREELMKSIGDAAGMARSIVKKNGSSYLSYNSTEMLIKDLKLQAMNSKVRLIINLLW